MWGRWARLRRWAALPAAMVGCLCLLLFLGPARPPIVSSPLRPVRAVHKAPPPAASRCPKRLGRVGILVINTNASLYADATNLVRCYAASRGYPFFMVNPFEDQLARRDCGHLRQVR